MNENFESLEKWQKRVAIAQDVIAALKSEQIFATTGIYLELDDEQQDVLSIAKPNDQYSDLLQNVTYHACAIGCIFVCAVKRFNEYTAKDGKSGNGSRGLLHNHMRHYLMRYFDKEQLDLMEYSFEKYTLKREYPLFSLYSLYDAGFNFCSQYENTKDRMIAIMENIIQNKGTFRP